MLKQKNTALYYLQARFNLLKEESEGFSKLITELNMVEELGDVNLSLDHIRSLIGKFNLDPNRCIDLVLDAYESSPYVTAYIDILRIFKSESVNQILGFKFQCYNDPKTPSTPDSLYILTAVLLANKVIELKDLLPHLSPNMDDFLQGN